MTGSLCQVAIAAARPFDMQRDQTCRWSPILQRMISDLIQRSRQPRDRWACGEHVISGGSRSAHADELTRHCRESRCASMMPAVDRFDASGAGRLSIWDDLWALLTPSDHRSRGAFAITTPSPSARHWHERVGPIGDTITATIHVFAPGRNRRWWSSGSK